MAASAVSQLAGWQTAARHGGPGRRTPATHRAVARRRRGCNDGTMVIGRQSINATTRFRPLRIHAACGSTREYGHYREYLSDALNSFSFTYNIHHSVENLRFVSLAAPQLWEMTLRAMDGWIYSRS